MVEARIRTHLSYAAYQPDQISLQKATERLGIKQHSSYILSEIRLG